MATKDELEAELALLREQNEAFRLQAEQRPEETAQSAGTARDRLSTNVQEVLEEHGIDTASVEAMSSQLKAELVKFQRDQPLLSLLGAFAVGCVVGRALR